MVTAFGTEAVEQNSGLSWRKDPKRFLCGRVNCMTDGSHSLANIDLEVEHFV